MKFNFEKLIDVDSYNRKIESKVREIKQNALTKSCTTKGYLDSLANYFEDDLKQTIYEIYKKAIVKTNGHGIIRYKLSTLKKCIYLGVKNSFLPSYRYFLLSDYNTGGMFPKYPQDLQKYNSFRKRIRKILKEQCDTHEMNYKEVLNKNRIDLLFKILGSIGGIIAVTTLLIKLFKK